HSSGRVYVRANEFPSPSRLFIVDGNPATFHLVAQPALGLENGSDLVIDEAAGRVVASSGFSLKNSIIDIGGPNADTETAVIQSPQPNGDLGVNSASHKAYVDNGVLMQVVNLSTRALE